MYNKKREAVDGLPFLSGMEEDYFLITVTVVSTPGAVTFRK